MLVRVMHVRRGWVKKKIDGLGIMLSIYNSVRLLWV